MLLNAPLQDPVKYQIMGYEVSLRRSEADLIEVIALNDKSLTERKPTEHNPAIEPDASDPYEQPFLPSELTDAVNRQRHIINVALVGNPNCGKTSLFNFASGAHERVGNYSGVTVDAKYGHTEFEGYHIELVDLPGTYSLSAYSPEELYVRSAARRKDTRHRHQRHRHVELGAQPLSDYPTHRHAHTHGLRLQHVRRDGEARRPHRL